MFHILKEYRKLQQMSSGTQRAEQFYKVRSLARENQDSLYNLIFSSVPEQSELRDLVFLGMHGGSVAREDNTEWIDFLSRIRIRQSELPKRLQGELNWLLRANNL